MSDIAGQNLSFIDAVRMAAQGFRVRRASDPPGWLLCTRWDGAEDELAIITPTTDPVRVSPVRLRVSDVTATDWMVVPPALGITPPKPRTRRSPKHPPAAG